MNWKDIKTRRELTQYLIAQFSRSEGESQLLPNFDSSVFWTDEPVSAGEVASAIREWRCMASGASPVDGKNRTSPPPNAATLPGNECPVCKRDADCTHLLLAIYVQSQDAFAGALLEQLEILEDRFAELFAQVVARQAICGHGLVREATRAYFGGYGEVAGTNELHAELDRNYVLEYLADVLDCASNILRTKREHSDDTCEYIWSETPEAAVVLVRDRLQELQRLIDLPEEDSEWSPQNLEDYQKI